jgi:Mg-chelatase subunit ChlD
VERILEGYQIGPNKTKVAVITFSAGSRLEFDFNRYDTKEAVLEAIKDLAYTDGMCTTIYRALKQARQEVFDARAGDRPDVKNVVIILTDGETNPGTDRHKFPRTKILFLSFSSCTILCSMQVDTTFIVCPWPKPSRERKLMN